MGLRTTRCATFAAPLLAFSVAWSAPNIGFIYPAGGQRGTTLAVSVGGQTLTGANAAYCSIPGVQTRILGYDRPATQMEINNAREKQQELVEKQLAARSTSELKPGATRPVWTAEDQRKLEDTREILAKRPNRLATPAIAETVLLLVTIPAAVQPGDYEFRLRTTAGLSNPLVFQVSDLPESADLVVTGSTNPPAALATRDTNQRSPVKKPAREVTLPVVVNGQIMPGEVDRIRFTARQGQKLTLAVSARALIPYLADAVPGWFQATLALVDAKGHEVAYDDDNRFNPDPLVTCTIPADGEYTAEIKDSIYRGREDFVYRLAMGELPYLTGIFPLGSAVHTQSTFELEGWNLPTEHLSIAADDRAPGTFLLAVRNQGKISNPVRFAIDPQPAVMETAEPNETLANAQPLTLPAIVNGRIDSPTDTDFYAFDGRAGEKIVAEIFARRLQSPLDSVLELTDATGKRVAFNDDSDDKASGLTTHHADSRLACTLPADGRFFVRVSDAQHRGGREFAYRLHIGPPQPDFELRVVPSTINVRAGASTPITVYALRHDGFDGEIILALKDAPRGFMLSGARIPPGRDKIDLTVTAPLAPPDEPCNLRLVGRGDLGDHPLIHTAIPADDMMQAFLYRHLVTAKEFKVNVAGRGFTLRPIGTTLPLRFIADHEVRMTFATTALKGANKVHVELTDPPVGIAVKKTRVLRDGFEVVLACDPAQVKSGLEGNLILQVFAERAAAKAGKSPQRTPVASIPAIPYEIGTPPKPST